MTVEELRRLEAEERLVQKWERYRVGVADIEAYLGHPLASVGMTWEEHAELEEELARIDAIQARQGKPLKNVVLRKRSPSTRRGRAH